MNTCLLLVEFERSVVDAADARQGDILPMLVKRLERRDGLVSCYRHNTLMPLYVSAKRHYEHVIKNELDASVASTNYKTLRTKYKDTPCTCWNKRR